MDKKISTNLVWKLFERFGVLGIQFILQIILARILAPRHYGMLSLMVSFTTLANVFIQRGFNTSLVQNKDVTEEDYSSVFWVTMALATVIYLTMFACAPLLARLYDMPEIIMPFRVLCLIMFPGALNSIQLAKISREMNFKQVFKSNMTGIVLSGVIGISLAYMGAGLWALVVQTLSNVLITCVVMWFTVKWRPRLICNMARVKVLISFGWKLLVSSVIDTLYEELRSWVIGIKYNADMLGYYNRGKQFPQFISSAIDGAVQSVLLPAMSAEQEHKDKVKALMRNSVMLSSYIVFPMMLGLAGVATPLIRLLLTDKWLPAVPFMQIYCCTCAFLPVHTSNLQAINAMGRSDIFLKLEIVKKIQGIAVLLIAIFCFESPLAIAVSGLITTITSSFINAYPNKKLIGYSYVEQMKDILPSLLAAMLMCGAVMLVELLNLSDLVMLALQVLLGVALYIGLSIALRLEPFRVLLGMLRTMGKNRK